MSIVVSTRKGLFQYSTDGSLETQAFLGDPVSLSFLHEASGTLFAALEHGHFGVKLQRSSDGMKHWEECTCPVFPKKPDDCGDDKNSWSLEMIWAFASGHGPTANRIYCGTIPGGLFYSDDLGDTWVLVESLWNMPERKAWVGGGKDQPGIHSICIDPRNDQHLYVGVSCGGVWFSPDGGLTWQSRAKGMRAEYMPPEQAYLENAQDPHCVVQCPGSPDYFWCQHHNGIFYSQDAAKTWQECEEVQPSAFGFACVVDPKNPKNAWFIPAIKDEKRIPVDGKLVVTTTKDGGNTFQTLTQGLPTEPAYDLIYRHAFAIDQAGECLAFGSTTGSLWISVDSGESWTLVSAHLPPVHAVCLLETRIE